MENLCVAAGINYKKYYNDHGIRCVRLDIILDCIGKEEFISYLLAFGGKNINGSTICFQSTYINQKIPNGRMLNSVAKE